jgi:phosphatidate phosphatase PAH1
MDMRCTLALLGLAALALLSGCGDDGPGLPSCADVKQAVVTDIDETLTTSDAEFVLQLLDPAYDPKLRAGGPELMQGYAERGYVIYYLTARSKTLVVGDSLSAEQATLDWLERHGFPLGEGRAWLTLSESTTTGDDTTAYKAAALQARQAEGTTFSFAYGNATTDIDAYAEAGIPLAATFIIGAQAGVGGTQAIAGEDFLAHAAAQLPLVAPICAFP